MFPGFRHGTAVFEVFFMYGRTLQLFTRHVSEYEIAVVSYCLIVELLPDSLLLFKTSRGMVIGKNKSEVGGVSPL